MKAIILSLLICIYSALAILSPIPNAVNCTYDENCKALDSFCGDGVCVLPLTVTEGEKCDFVGALICGLCDEIFQCEESMHWRRLGCPAGTSCKDGYCSEGPDCVDQKFCKFPVSNCSDSNNQCSVGVCSGISGKCEFNYTNEGSECQLCEDSCTKHICLKGECIPKMQEDGTVCKETGDICGKMLCRNGTCTSVLAEGNQCEESNDPCTLFICMGGECTAEFLKDNTVCNVSDDLCSRKTCMLGECQPLLKEGDQCLESSPCQSHICTNSKCTTTIDPDGTICSPSDDLCLQNQCQSGVCTSIHLRIPKSSIIPIKQ